MQTNIEIEKIDSKTWRISEVDHETAFADSIAFYIDGLFFKKHLIFSQNYIII